MINTELTISTDLLCKAFEERNKGFRLRFYEDFEHRILRAVASTKPIEPVRFWEQKLSFEPAPWVGSWWARMIRKLTSYKWFRDWLIPYPIKCLATAKRLNSSVQVDEVKESALSEIHAQVCRLRMNNLEPYCILIGGGKLEDAIINSGPYIFDASYVLPKKDDIRVGEIMGIPYITFPFVDPNTVIVVPSYDKTR